MKMIIEDFVEEMQEFIAEVHPYDSLDVYELEDVAEWYMIEGTV